MTKATKQNKQEAFDVSVDHIQKYILGYDRKYRPAAIGGLAHGMAQNDALFTLYCLAIFLQRNGKTERVAKLGAQIEQLLEPFKTEKAAA